MATPMPGSEELVLDGEPRDVVARRYLTDRRGHIAREDFDPVTGAFLMRVHEV